MPSTILDIDLDFEVETVNNMIVIGSLNIVKRQLIEFWLYNLYTAINYE